MQRESLESAGQYRKSSSESIETTKKSKLLKSLILGAVVFWVFVAGFWQGYIFDSTFKNLFWQEHKVDPLTVCQIQLERMNEDLMAAQSGEPVLRKKDEALRKVLHRNMGIYRNQNK
jgi:hypothetical protein